jgi:anti-sigma B factor antagonist
MTSEKVPDASGARQPSATDQKQRPNKRLNLSLEPERSGLAIVLHCQGRTIFRQEAREISAIVSDILPTSRRMIVDLAGVDSVDQGGLGELVLTQLWAEASGYTLTFASPKKSVRRLFEITNVASIFDVYPSVADAMLAMVPLAADPS